MSHTYEYPRPSLTVDVVLYRWRGGWLEVLLIERAHDPFAGRHALPGASWTPARRPRTPRGGAAGGDRGAHRAPGARGVFGRPGRDPRGWVVTRPTWAWRPPTRRPWPVTTRGAWAGTGWGPCRRWP
ncbi:MAG: hypothetical protein R3F43_01350 [bacterium]